MALFYCYIFYPKSCYRVDFLSFFLYIRLAFCVFIVFLIFHINACLSNYQFASFLIVQLLRS